MLVAASAPALAQPGVEEIPPPAPAPMPQPPPPPPSAGTVVVVQPEAGQGYASQQPPVRAVVAPMNEDWNNVSHINGHPVKVGERGDYLYDYKKTNISSNPIGWMFGFYGLSVSHALGRHAALRADANYFDIDDDSGYEVGLTVPLYFKQVYKGPFLEGGIMIRQLDDDCYDCMEKPAPNVGPQVMFGWHWSFDSGANVAIAMGAFRPMNDGKTKDDVEPAGYFRIGYAY
jgi:hypothetical protein